MAAQDTTALKEKIISIIRSRGPSFPAHISSQVGMSILFTSAFLSELLSEKKLKISNMRIGTSPLYFIPGQEPLLDRYSGSLKSREKDAFILLKDKKFLMDSEQEPAIRVALRAIKDFAIPFEKSDKLYWKYLTADENELVVKSDKKVEPKKLEIFDKKPAKKKTVKKKVVKKKVANKGNDKFFNKVKEYLLDKGIEISDIISFSKDDLVVKIKSSKAKPLAKSASETGSELKKEKESIVFAYNKKRVNEEDIVKAYKKVSDFDMGYSILCLGEPAKKTLGLIDAIKNLSDIQNIG